MTSLKIASGEKSHLSLCISWHSKHVLNMKYLRKTLSNLHSMLKLRSTQETDCLDLCLSEGHVRGSKGGIGRFSELCAGTKGCVSPRLKQKRSIIKYQVKD